MIDIHAHIMPYTDDGAQDMEEALEMARLAYESGTRYLVMTPHVNAPGIPGNLFSSEMHSRYSDFRRAVKDAGIPLHIGYGAEVFADAGMHRLLADGRLLPLCGSHYLLVEFDFGIDPMRVRDALEQISRAGMIPVMAHPERYRLTAHDPRAIFDWVQSGCLMQINKDSLLGNFGSTTAEIAHMLLSHGLVHCVASDMHHADVRTPCLDTVYRHLCKIKGEDCARILLHENPKRIIGDKQIIQSQMVPF